MRYFIIGLLFLTCCNSRKISEPSTVNKPQNVPACKFYLEYTFAGLGSNLGKLEPVFRIIDTSFLYTKEQNSYYDKPDKKPDTLMAGNLRRTAVDSIISIFRTVKQKEIHRFHPGVMSGGIHFLFIAVEGDTLSYQLTNTFDSTALQIMSIVNGYIPADEKIWLSENLMRSEKEYWDQHSIDTLLPDKKRPRNKWPYEWK